MPAERKCVSLGGESGLTSSEAGAVQRLGQLLQFLLSLEEYEVPLVLLDEVHLVDQTKYFRLEE